MSLKARLRALEAATPDKPWFIIEIDGDATPEQQAEIDEAHAVARTVFVFQNQGDTLGIWLPAADDILWSTDNA